VRKSVRALLHVAVTACVISLLTGTPGHIKTDPINGLQMDADSADKIAIGRHAQLGREQNALLTSRIALNQ
jgi:hypothetical protein